MPSLTGLLLVTLAAEVVQNGNTHKAVSEINGENKTKKHEAGSPLLRDKFKKEGIIKKVTTFFPILSTLTGDF